MADLERLIERIDKELPKTESLLQDYGKGRGVACPVFAWRRWTLKDFTFVSASTKRAVVKAASQRETGARQANPIRSELQFWELIKRNPNQVSRN